jgi:geranylgeranyl diphosphate synthase type II
MKAAFEEYLAGYPLQQAPSSLYGPVAYIMQQPGKRIRPVLLLLAYTLYRTDYIRALPAALAVEYFHNFTLVHDDIMDEAALRRGAKSVPAKFGQNAAILSGDLMLIKSFDLLVSASLQDDTGTILGIFADAATRICEGQQLDMDFELEDAIEVGDYLNMIERKTAALLGCAMQVGALLGGASESHADQLNEIGIQLGKAFQIQDDILDAYGDEIVVGKRRGGDILQRKKSILYALAWESASRPDRVKLTELYNQDVGNPEVKIQKVLGFFDTLDVKRSAEQLRDHCFREVKESLDRLTAEKVNTLPLRELVQSMLDRSY